MSNVKIISDGTARGTRVEVDGKIINCITKIEIDPLEVGLNFVRAKLTIDTVKLCMEIRDATIECNDSFIEEKIRQVLLDYNKDSD